MATRRLSIYPNSQNFDDNLFELQRNFSSLSTNLQHLNSINESLLAFNKNFSVFLQGLSLNSECLEFPEAPNADTYTLAERPPTPPTPEVAPQVPSSAMSVDSFQEAEQHVSGVSKGGAAERGKKRVVIKTGMKRRKPVFQTRRITDLLPSRFKDQPHKGVIELILKELNLNRDGMYAHEIVRDVGGGLNRNKCMDYMNALVHTESVVRVNKKGHLFYLDPEKFPQ
ncbi:DASH complex subunit dam1 [Coemansia sp. RSA 1722]|nr:DASH complex subunit dam1 [Coemansia sp. RSA 486]KAJ2238427.1 DASH complex subunit dam1 [Coemansia sp. RSA 485]KAJ2606898.1 DASH complex subunit dam1 [Coemansia sp. RSA 1722]